MLPAIRNRATAEIASSMHGSIVSGTRYDDLASIMPYIAIVRLSPPKDPAELLLALK